MLPLFGIIPHHVRSRGSSIMNAKMVQRVSHQTPPISSMIATTDPLRLQRPISASCVHTMQHQHQNLATRQWQQGWQHRWQQQHRHCSDWKVPQKVTIPEDQLDITFQRSSGAGGQNVNKVNTKAEIRFHVPTAQWIPREVRDRLLQQQSNRINKDGYLSLNSQEHRTQLHNRREAIQKLQDLVLQAYPRPKERKQRVGISKEGKQRNIERKRRRSETKKGRRRSRADW